MSPNHPRKAYNKPSYLPADASKKTAEWKTNNADPDQMQHSAVSYLGLHCLLRSVCPITYGKFLSIKYLICSLASVFIMTIWWYVWISMKSLKYEISMTVICIAPDKVPFSIERCCFLQKSIDIFLISPQNRMLWYLLEAPQWGASNEYPQHMFSWRNKKNIYLITASYLELSIIQAETQLPLHVHS